MRWLKFFLSLSITGILIYGLSRPWGAIRFPVGDFVNPFSGFWQNAEPESPDMKAEINLPGLKAPVKVVYDDRMVPHVFAGNNEDLFYVQGYLNAKDRLWQMDFQSRAAAGRLTEVVGFGADSSVLRFDRTNRRKGLVFGAENSFEASRQHPELSAAIEQFARGVNAYIESLSPADYPIEYKLLNYEPKPWTSFDTWLIQKYFANMLAARVDDIRNTNALMMWGRNIFDILYPDQMNVPYPIIPDQPTWNRRLANPSPPVPEDYSPDSILLQPSEDVVQPADPGIGSNNWAISGERSTTGKPILANDPHLGLNLPSLWYEMQLQSPDMNVYGVTLLGGPGIILGFNDSVAWGTTNAGVDVMDYYRVELNEDETQYYFEGKWTDVKQKIEEYKDPQGNVYYDTVLYTNIGPVMYDEHFGDQPRPLAVKWMAHEPTLDPLFMFKMQTARNYKDYEDALQYWSCPMQNFIFASAAGDIAIWQSGSYINRWPGQGRFIQDGTRQDFLWNSIVPGDQNPHVVNPENGFVTSTNQRATTGQYPYYYNGSFEDFRNRRISRLLSKKEKMSVEDMKRFQLDNYSVLAEDILPLMISELDSASLSPEQMKALETLKNWDYMYDREQVAPTLFEQWWNTLYSGIWQDEIEAADRFVSWPETYTTVQILLDSAEFAFYDNVARQQSQDRKTLINQSFSSAVDSLVQKSPNEADRIWGNQRQTDIRHLSRSIRPFGRYGIPTDGNRSILNAITRTSGPSWRMVVALGDEIEAYGVYPGGQSGNPGSRHYDDFLDEWNAGEYFKLWFMKNPEDPGGTISKTQTFTANPKSQ